MKDKRKVINAWAFYDWANSVFPLVITASVFPAYYSSVAVAADGGDIIGFFGFEVKNTILYTWSFSFAYLLTAFISPFLSGIADYTGNKKGFMLFFVLLGSVSCSALYFFTGTNIYIGIGAFILANIGFNGSLVFYNSFLPEIASPSKMDQVSAKGYAMGYGGSVILLILNLLLITYAADAGIQDKLQPYRISFLSVGIWWLLFSQYTFIFLPKGSVSKIPGRAIFTGGYRELMKNWRELKKINNIKYYLAGFFLVSMGMQTVIYMASLFGINEIHMSGEQLILVIIIIQFVGIAGAWLFSVIAKFTGNIRALSFGIVLWIAACLAAYAVHSAIGFFLVAALVGLLMGGTQSIARSTYAKLMPIDNPDTASYFSFYEFSEKVAIVMGTAAYGLIEMLTGSMRNSVFALSLFFICGLFILLKVKIPHRLSNLPA